MKLHSVPAPASEGQGHSRPILSVRYLGQNLSYAKFISGRYEFMLAAEIVEAIQDGFISVRYQMDDDMPVGIILEDVEP